MRGLTHNILAALVDYIDLGEVEVKEADLEEWVAEPLVSVTRSC